ncbi:DUF1801 domain-containing protein [Neobacillus sp. MER 74]|uniref:DUF1801 domain-containing protein n=1 Tax=Neobacillus sp. MER 74 TaxID=2939566 RepID=UPI00203BA193|nr:DUF1801 domain-containing protein [Neobacillus sp. MER 74]MCM3118801.1 DUF1801 domain-containing protein [Neobacillus sp. MER 74]
MDKEKETDLTTAKVQTFDKLIESYPTQIKDIVETLRAVSKANMSDTYEFVYHNALNYKLSESPGTWVCYISAQRNHVRLGFYFGANLYDPRKLLEGTGKRMCHIKVRTVMEADCDELAQLIRQSWSNLAEK